MQAFSSRPMAFFGFSVLALAVSSALVSPAAAEERWPRWYVGVAGGVNFVDDSDIHGSRNGELSYNTGPGLALSVGHMPFFNQPFLDRLRLEAELGYRQAGLDGFTNAGVPAAARDDIKMLTYMANVYYDFTNSSQWTPYLGAGLGGAQVRLAENSGLGNTGDSDTVLAYQFLAGVSYAPTSIPMTEWGLGYRYLAVDSPEYSTAGAAKLHLDDVGSHGVEANARFKF